MSAAPCPPTGPSPGRTGLPLPRVVVAAPSSSSGKTTLAVGLMAALRERGLAVAPAKTGPDYIDPGYHALATGRPGRNLDAHLCGPGLVAPLLAHGALTPSPADVAVVEGAMGLFDGRLGTPPVGRAGFGSSAHIAKLLDAPVLLVVDAARSSTTVAAVVHGMAGFDPGLRVAGVLLNKVGSARNVAECTRAVEELGIPVVGAVPRSTQLATPSRHLGLVPAAERDQAAAMVRAAGDLVAAHVDLDAVLALARCAPPLEAEPWDASRLVEPVPGRPRIAVAGGRAFTFHYPETTELLQAAGCEVVAFDPLTDPALPPGTRGLYLGGGFPEVHAAELAANASLRDDVARRVRDGMPTVAECAGLLYLCRTLDGRPMAGALDLAASMTPRLVLGYRDPVAATDSLLFRAGERVASHEFHRTGVAPATPGGALPAAWHLDGRDEGVCSATLHASYQHLHWAALPHAAQRFARAAAKYPGDGDGAASSATADVPDPGRGTEPRCGTEPGHKPEPERGADPGRGAVPGQRPNLVRAEVPEPASSATPEPDLTHHGDRDLADGLVDLAVNVRSPRPTPWLVDRLCSRRDQWAGYPSASRAREAIAARHGVDPSMVLPTAGAAEAFTLVARALAVREALVVHPQFTEPEQALRLAGHLPRRHLLRAADGFRLDPSGVPAGPDLVVVGNPTNPTSVLHPAEALCRLARPGRVLLVDEAFLDVTPGEQQSLVAPRMDGLLVLRSLTKTWSLAGVRAGYLVGDPRLVRRLERAQTPWSVSTPALDAMVACSSPDALAELERVAAEVAGQRAVLVQALAAAGLPPVADPQAPFVLVDTSPLGPLTGRPGWVREQMAARGHAVRRGESFPGLGPQWIRLAVRDAATSLAAVEALSGLRHADAPPHPAPAGADGAH